MTVGAALILVFVLIAAYFCVRRGPSNGGSRRKRANDNRISYTETHIPLQKGIDDCIDDHNSGGTALTPMLPDHERNPDIIPISRRGKESFKNNVDFQLFQPLSHTWLTFLKNLSVVS